MKYDLIIFDCDGTLIDSESLGSKALSAVLTAHGYTEYTFERCTTEFVGVPDNIVFLQLQMKHKDIKIAEVRTEYIRMMSTMVMKDLEPIAGAHELMKELGDMKKCIASNGDFEVIKATLEITKLSQYFKDEHIFTYDKIGKAKPDPTMFLHAAEVFNISPAKCLVIEDSYSGIKAANLAEMDVLQVLCGHKNQQPDTSLLVKNYRNNQ